MATQITADLPTLDFPREVDYPTQEDWAAFSAAAEENFGILGGDWSTQMQIWKTQANAMSIELNNNADIAQAVANYQGDWVSQGYTLGQTVSVSGIYYICKLTHATGQNPTDVSSLYWNLAIGNWNFKIDKDISGYTLKTTPVDDDLIGLSDSQDSFGAKKLSWSNIKATLKAYFDTLYFTITASHAKLGIDNLLMIQDQKPSGTNADLFTLNAWKKTTKNTVVINNIGAIVSNSIVTLKAGTYYVESDEPVYIGLPTTPTFFKSRLYNITDSSNIIIGNSSASRTGAVSNEARHDYVKAYGLFTLPSTKNIEIDIYNTGLQGSNGITAFISGITEVYGTLKIWKVA